MQSRTTQDFYQLKNEELKGLLCVKGSRLMDYGLEIIMLRRTPTSRCLNVFFLTRLSSLPNQNLGNSKIGIVYSCIEDYQRLLKNYLTAKVALLYLKRNVVPINFNIAMNAKHVTDLAPAAVTAFI